MACATPFNWNSALKSDGLSTISPSPNNTRMRQEVRGLTKMGIGIRDGLYRQVTVALRRAPARRKSHHGSSKNFDFSSVTWRVEKQNDP